MWTSSARLHGQRHTTGNLSFPFSRLKQVSTFERPWAKICTSKLRFVGHRRGVAQWTVAASQRLYTRATSLKLLDGEDQTNGTQSCPEASSNGEQELRILERAQAFGIMTVEDILRQCAFKDRSLYGAQLVNRKPYSDTLELWCILLDFQMLRFGEQGVRRLWHVMKDKGGRVDEFFEGPVSDRLWAVLISTGLKSPSWLRQLCKHEMRFGAKRSSLCVDIVGNFLAINKPRTAYLFAQELQDSHPVTSDDAYHLFMQACHSINKDALKNFLSVCKTFQKARIYSRAIPYLCSQERFVDAWTMHKFLLSRGDLPSDFASVKPLIAHIASAKDRFEEFLQGLKDHDIAYENQARRVQEHQKSLQYGIASGTLNIVSSGTMGVQPSALSDKFVARAFATKTLSFDLILHGLHLLGLREIGPLALHQISLSAGIPPEICRRLELLKELSIDHGSSTYARVVTTLAKQGKATLLSDVLASDQHPDVFEDVDLQEKLLAQYYRDSDWRQVNRTLAILRVANQEFLYDERLSMQETSLNVLLRSVLRIGDWPGVIKIVGQVKLCGCRLTTRTLRCMHNTILSKRQPARRPILNKHFDDIGFLLSLYQTAKNGSIQIPPTFWREPIRRLGKLRRWSDLERMVFWLAARYSQHRAASKRDIIVKEHVISRIFSPSFQEAVVEWAFLRPKSHLSGAPSRLDFEARQSDGNFVGFERGVKVLRMLHDQHGVVVDETHVRIACLRGLRKRFALDYFLGQLVKDNIHDKYHVSLLPKALNQLNTAWSGSLFDSESRALHKCILRPRRLMRLRQRQRPRFRGLELQTQDRHEKGLQRTVLSQLGKDQGPNIGEYQSKLDWSHVEATTGVDPVEDIVMYRDIYNISLEDYRTPDFGAKTKKTAGEG
jgi:hypothetical protein